MALKIYTKNNFTILQNTNGGDTDHIPTVDFDFEIDANGNVELFAKSNRKTFKKNFWGDIQDEAGLPIGATLSDVEEFLTTLSQSPDGGSTPVDPVDPPQEVVNNFKATTDGTVSAGAKVVSFVFRGNGGTLNGMEAVNGYAKEYFYPNGESLPSISYTVPTSGGGGATSRGIYINVSL